jgi:hypothetical protein
MVGLLKLSLVAGEAGLPASATPGRPMIRRRLPGLRLSPTALRD